MWDLVSRHLLALLMGATLAVSMVGTVAASEAETEAATETVVVANGEYKPNMALDMACTIKNGTLYFDAVPDAGVVTITKN